MLNFYRGITYYGSTYFKPKFWRATSIYLRGGKPKHSLILLDGIPLNDSLDANGYDLAHFDINGIERVEVLKGPYSSLYGSGALSGVINIISKKGYNNPKKSILIEKGSFDSTKLGVSIYEDSLIILILTPRHLGRWIFSRIDLHEGLD